MESLKTLNQYLVKETTENRSQIETLKSQIEELSLTFPFAVSIERDVCRIVLSESLSEKEMEFEAQAENLELEVEKVASLERELEVLVAEKAAEVEKVASLEEKLEFVVKEKDVMKKVLEFSRNELELKRSEVRGFESRVGELEKGNEAIKEKLEGVLAERRDLERDFEEVMAEKVAEMEKVACLEESLKKVEKKLGFVLNEKDEIEKALGFSKRELDLKVSEVQGYEMMVGELEKANVEIREKLEGVVAEHDVLERDFESVMAEKAAEVIRAVSLEERLASEMEALKKTEEKLGIVMSEKDEIKKALEFAVSEKDFNKKELDSKQSEVLGLELKVGELEKANSEIKGTLEVVLVERDELEHQLRKSYEGLKTVEQFVETLEKKTVDLVRKNEEQIEALKAEKEVYVTKVSSLEEECRSLVETKNGLEADVSASKDAFGSLKKEADALESKVAQLEIAKRDEVNHLRVTVGMLEEQIEEKEKKFESEIRESTMKSDGLRKEMEIISQEKDEIEQARLKQEKEILELQKEVAELNSKVLELQELCKSHTVTNSRLQSDKDEARRSLALKEEEAVGLRLQLDELKKNKYAILEELNQLKAAFDALDIEREEGKKQIDLLTVEKASLEKSLLAAREKFEGMERKMRSAEMISNKARSLLRSTAEVMHGLEKAEENGIHDEDIHPFVIELESIKMAFKSRDEKVEEKNREVEILKSVVADFEKKKRGLWKWFYPATTTFLAAVSLAYAARAH